MIRHSEDLRRVERAMGGEAELEAIGACLFEGSGAIDTLAGIVEPRHFHDDRARAVFEALLIRSGEGKSTSAESVAPLVKAHGVTADDLVEMMNAVPHGLHVDVHGKRVLEAWKRRQIRYTMTDAIAAARAPATDVDEVLQTAIGKLEAVLENGTSEADDGHIEDHLLRLANTPTLPRHPTGIRSLDGLLRGGLAPGQLICVGARPSVGKSAFCGQMALSIATGGVPALVLSLEMSGHEMTGRYLAQAGASLADTESSGRLAGCPLFVREAGGWSIDRIECEARRYARRYGVKLVVVDYLSLVRPRDGRLPRYEQVGEISRSLKQLALQNELIVVAAQQLSRDIEKREDRRPRMSDFRESGSIEQDSDILLGLDRAVTPDRGDIREARLIVMKHRGGSTGDLTLRFDPRRTLFTDADHERIPV